MNPTPTPDVPIERPRSMSRFWFLAMSAACVVSVGLWAGSLWVAGGLALVLTVVAWWAEVSE